MCLNNITKRYEPADPKVRKAWKYVKVESDGTFVSIFQGYFYSTEWKKSYCNYTISCTNDKAKSHHMREQYIPGFHVFPTREEARKAKSLIDNNDGGSFSHAEGIRLAQVEVRGVTVEGTDATSSESSYLDANIKTLVAKEMRIIKIVKKG
jgi:hypothetical protein